MQACELAYLLQEIIELFELQKGWSFVLIEKTLDNKLEVG